MKGALQKNFEEEPQGSSCVILGKNGPLIAVQSVELKAAQSELEHKQFTAEDRCGSPGDLAREVRNSTAGTFFCMTSKNRLKTENGRLKLLLEFECDLTSDI